MTLPKPPGKPELRREMRRRLRELAPDERMAKSRAICEAIARHPAYAGAQIVALFDPLPAEPHVELLWEMAPRRFVYPRVDGVEMALLEVPSHTALVAAPGGARYREPADLTSEVPIERVGLILVPGLAFTRTGQRLGRGGGHYDRLLARTAPGTVKLGVCFGFQLLSSLPTESHDVRLDGVISEMP